MHVDDTDPPAIFIQSASIPEHLPKFSEENAIDLADPSATPRIWVGNSITVTTHYDISDNIACVVGGRRRFTLFPPDQIRNLYVGPIHFTLAGQPVSMVSLEEPDFIRYPRFEQALATAQTAELEPGDAIFIPYFWWHHVKSLERFNVLVNYWWDARPAQVRFTLRLPAARISHTASLARQSARCMARGVRPLCVSNGCRSGGSLAAGTARRIGRDDARACGAYQIGVAQEIEPQLEERQRPHCGLCRIQSRGRGGFLERHSEVEQVRAAVDLIATIVREILRVVVGTEARPLIGQIAPL